MANELTKAQSGVVALVDSREIGDVLKPLIREIHLFDSYVAGTTHLEDKSVLEEINIGDKLNLLREDIKYDNNAILIITEGKKKLGYVTEKDNLIFARLMDAGKLLVARITQIKIRGNYHQISIGIYLVDF